MKPTQNTRGILRKVLKYLKRYTPALLLSLLLAAASVVLTLYIPILIGDAIDLIIEPGRVFFEEIVPLLVRIGIAAAAAALFQWVMSIINNKITYNTVHDIRTETFEKLQKLPISYMDSHAHGEIVSRIITDADQFSDGLLMGFSQLFTSR